MSVSAVTSESPTDDRDVEAAGILWLLDAPGLGPRRVLDMLQKFGHVSGAISAIEQGLTGSEGLREYLATTKVHHHRESIRRTRELGGDFKIWSDRDYPANLSLWQGRPPILFYKGDLTSLSRRSLALVGRVDPTETGASEAARFARKCVDNGIAVVSGLAKGIDGASHREALRPPAGFTHAVVAHGLDYAYPAENRDLYAAIPDNGAVISQFATGTGPQRWTFPARNEVMCTLALGTVIIEGKEGCGSIIQADFSFKHDRPVFLLSRNLKGADSAWAHALVARGAHVIERFDQVLEIMDKTLTEAETHPIEEPLFVLAGDNSKSPNAMGAAGMAVLFDLDGVVVDTRTAMAEACAEIASAHTGRVVSATSIDLTGSPRDVLGRLGVKSPYDVYKREYDRAFRRAAGSIVTFEGAARGIAELRRTGFRVGAVTAQPRRRAEAIVPAEVMVQFESVLAYGETRGDKSEGIARLLREFGVDRSRAMYIGDQPKDVEAARKAGVLAVAVLWGYSTEAELRRWSPDLLLSEPGEIGPDLAHHLGG